MFWLLFIMMEGEEILPTRYFNMIEREEKNLSPNHIKFVSCAAGCDVPVPGNPESWDKDTRCFCAWRGHFPRISNGAGALCLNSRGGGTGPNLS